VCHERDWLPWDGDEPYDGPLWVVSVWSVKGTAYSAILGSLG